MIACPCQFCARALEPAQQLRFYVETETLGEPVHLNRIRRLPATRDGKPLRVCAACQRKMETNAVRFRAELEHVRQRRQVKMGLFTAFGVLSAGWVLNVLIGSQRV